MEHPVFHGCSSLFEGLLSNVVFHDVTGRFFKSDFLEGRLQNRQIDAA